MSIINVVASLEKAGRLKRYVPDGTQLAQRTLFLTAEAVKEYNDPQSAICLLVGRGFIKGALDRWVLGGRVHGDKHRGRFICPLHPPPDDVWEIKVIEPINQGRLFFRFLQPNSLVLTHMHTRRFLDENDAWRTLDAGRTSMQNSVGLWGDLFPDHAPFRGAAIHEYVTENCDDFPSLPEPLALEPLVGKEVGDYGLAQVRDIAFDAVSKLWRRRRAEGMLQKKIADNIGRDTATVSKNLRGPGNWTFRTFGELVQGMGGRVQIVVDASEDPPSDGKNYDAYSDFDASATGSTSVLNIQFTLMGPIHSDPAVSLPTGQKSEFTFEKIDG